MKFFQKFITKFYNRDRLDEQADSVARFSAALLMR